VGAAVVDSLFLGSAAAEDGVVRVVAVRGAVALVPVVPVLAADRVVLGAAVPVVAGFRAAEAEAVPELVLEGLDVRVLVRRAAVVGDLVFFSSSLALTLGRLRWVEVVDVEPVAGRRTALVVVVGGRVGGLLRPPAARAVVDDVVPGVLDAVAVVVPGRRVAVVVVVELVDGRFAAAAAGFDSPLALAGVSEGVSAEVVNDSCAGASADSTEAASSRGTASMLSLSGMMQTNA
jgi:hypothetical protein